MHIEPMKTQNTTVGMHIGTIRAGIISLLVFALCYLWMTGMSDLVRAWLFIISFAVCFVLMMQSVVDLLVLAFGLAARFSGAGVGRSITCFRRIFSRAAPAA
jgi:hypothetical protein